MEGGPAFYHLALCYYTADVAILRSEWVYALSSKWSNNAMRLLSISYVQTGSYYYCVLWGTIRVMFHDPTI